MMPRPTDARADDPTRAVVNARGAARIRGGPPLGLPRTTWCAGPAHDAGDGGPALVARARTRAASRWASPPGRRAAAAGAAHGRRARGEPRARARWPSSSTSGWRPRSPRRLALDLDRDAYRVAHAESDGLPGPGRRSLRRRRRRADDLGGDERRARRDRRDRARRASTRAWWSPATTARRATSRSCPASPASLRGRRRRRASSTAWARTASRPTCCADGKTGGFLDQADNHAARRRAGARRARARSTRSRYHGGFALALARAGRRRCWRSTRTPTAVARATANARRNGLANLTRRARQRLRSAARARGPRRALRRGGGRSARAGQARRRRRRWPPPPAPTRSSSCAARASPARAGCWSPARARGGSRARTGTRSAPTRSPTPGARAHVLSRAGAGRDHPELVGVPETAHLKVWTFRIL